MHNGGFAPGASFPHKLFTIGQLAIKVRQALES